MFSFPLVKGDVETALSEPNTIVISESVARRIFGNEDPVEKLSMFIEEPASMQIVGIFKDVPENSHVKFDLLVSYATTYPWGWTQK